jgi:hypothetical protein
MSMNRSRAAIAAALLAAGLAATPASAAIKVATYTGVFGFDSTFTDLSVPTFTFLTTASFVATITYDSSLGDGGVDLISGGELRFGGQDVARPFDPSPILGFTLSISGPGVTDGNFAFTGTRSGAVSTQWGLDPKAIQHSAWTAAGDQIALTSFTNPPQVGLDADVVGATLLLGTGTFNVSNGLRFASGSLLTRSLEIVDRDQTPPPPPPGAIPEPATWALLIAGFGLVGTMARRRRGRAVSA